MCHSILVRSSCCCSFLAATVAVVLCLSAMKGDMMRKREGQQGKASLFAGEEAAQLERERDLVVAGAAQAVAQRKAAFCLLCSPGVNRQRGGVCWTVARLEQ